MNDAYYDTGFPLWNPRRWSRSDYVFPSTKTGDRYRDRRRVIKTICKRAGVKPYGYHAIRHYTASLLAESGVSLITISRLPRHKSIGTIEIYLAKNRR